MKTSIAKHKILITGATDGLGKHLAERFALQGAFVLLHGRNKEKGNKVVEELIQMSKNENLQYYNGDFSSLQEVKSLSENILHEHNHIDVLINNVGIGADMKTNKREISANNIELRFAVNYVAHVLLTKRLLSSLSGGISKIINVASVGQEQINFSNIMLEKNYDGFKAYKQSKTALIMYTFDLAERLMEKEIKVNAIHPATFMNTKMVLDDIGYSLSTIEDGVNAVESLLYAETTGKYYDGKNLSKAINQTYIKEERDTLKSITWKLIEEFL